MWGAVAPEPASCSGSTVSPLPPQGSSSSDSLEGQSCDYASKSYDAVVFDVLKVTPEEFAVSSRIDGVLGPQLGARGVTAQGFAQVGEEPYTQQQGIVE